MIKVKRVICWGEDGLSIGKRSDEFSGAMEAFYISIWVVVTCVYATQYEFPGLRHQYVCTPLYANVTSIWNRQHGDPVVPSIMQSPHLSFFHGVSGQPLISTGLPHSCDVPLAHMSCSSPGCCRCLLGITTLSLSYKAPQRQLLLWVHVPLLTCWVTSDK